MPQAAMERADATAAFADRTKRRTDWKIPE